MANNVLFDNEFLEELIKDNQRELYVRISVLDKNEHPIEQIEGKTIDGSINIDGKSIVRRTCNLTMTAENVDINLFYWGLKNKFILEVGLKNIINKKYPSIIWFKQGIFIITQFNTTQTVNKWTIKITGKDKMCLLNGDISGNLPHDVDFGKEEYHDLETDTVTYSYIPIKDIIRKIVSEFGGEPLQNIIINDIDEAGLILLEYLNESPAYLYKEINSNEYKNIILDDSIECLYKLKTQLTLNEYNLIPNKYSFLKFMYVLNEEKTYFVFNEKLANYEYYQHLDNNGWFIGSIGDSFNITYENLLENFEFFEEPTIIKFPNNKENNYTLAKIEYGDVPGYFLTDLTYAHSSSLKSSSKDLIAKAGESLTSVLNKIKDMLVNFEYYYDINGKFIFQKKQDYIITPWNNTDKNNLEYDIKLNSQNIMFNFLDSILISSFQNTPKINNLKNDYTVWGSYNNNGIEIPIHMRYALDEKPISYRPIRPLKEEIHTIIEKDGQELSNVVTYKYYDAPEIEPYNDDYLIKLMDFDKDINGFKASKTTIRDENGYNKTIIIYPYFAKNEYSTNELYYIEYKDSIEIFEDNKEPYVIKLTQLQNSFKSQDLYLDFNDYLKNKLKQNEYDALCEKHIIHYKVDWRELIYQMALDYRKCNYDDNFLYYVSLFNPHYPSGHTGYEQYYIDLEGFWRTLYNPNPKVEYEPILFNEVKQYTHLKDGIDNIYIEDGYRPINFNDFNNNELTAVDLYCLSSPTNGAQKMYPYIGSENCHLTLGDTYYVKENEIMKAYQANEINDNNYKLLNTFSLNNIFVKNVETFLTKYNENIDEYQYYLSYFMLNEQKEKIYKYFKVPMYSYDNSISKINNGYIKFTDVLFDQLLKNNETLEGYYIKDKKPLKLSEVYTENNNFYYSNFITFAYYAKNLQANLNMIDIKNYEDSNKCNYLEDYINLIQNYIIEMNQYNFSDLDNIIIDELNLILINSINFLQNIIDNFINNNNISIETSNLIIILNSLKSNLTDINELNSSSNSNNPLFKINLIKNIYINLQNSLKDIQNNWIQVKEINYLAEQINDLDENNLLENLKEILLTQKNNLEKIPESQRYINGQLQTTLNQLDERIWALNAYDDTVELDIFIQQQKQLIEATIINPVMVLNNFLEYAYEEENNNNSIILYLGSTIYENFYLLLSGIQNLTQLLQPRQFELEEIYSIISFYKTTYENVILLQSLYDLIYTALNKNELNKILQDYISATEDFQEYIISDTIDNFNQITSNILQFEKIKYYKSFYNYNNNYSDGNFWSLNIKNAPQLLLFWFDFLDINNNELSKFSIPAIGDRIKIVNDKKNIQAINYKQIPQIIFKRVNDKNYEIKDGYTYININNNTESLFTTSSRSKSAKEKIEELLYEYSYCAENVTIATIPVYHLEPNHHILIRDDKSNINGEYIVNKITIPLNYKKTMNITATKAISSIT